MDAGLEKATASVGTAKRLAAGLGITPQAISQWERVPARHILAVERETGVPREELRPDLYLAES